MARRFIDGFPGEVTYAVKANPDPVVIEALRHFARHGLCAAQRARDNAVAAHRSGDLAGYDWWLCVCRTLDRRMADALVNRTALHS